MDAIKQRYLSRIKVAVGNTAGAHSELIDALISSPALFEKPRTRTFHGVKVGYIKQRGQVIIDDEAAVIKRVRELLPETQAELIIKVRESIYKSAVYDLTTADLKRLGIRIDSDESIPVIKPTDTEVDKLVSALLKDAEAIGEGA